MDVKSRILRSLVTAAAEDCESGALDLTRAGIAHRVLLSSGVMCSRAPRDGARYDLVVCPLAAVLRACAMVRRGGSVLVHIKPGQHGELVGLTGEFGLVASARTPMGAWIRLERLESSGRVAPRVSLVVAGHNDGALLAQLLTTLLEQPTDPAWDLVVVDRDSRDATADLLDRVDGDLRQIRVPRDTDPVDALYAGIRAARGDIILPLAAGLAPECGFVSALLRCADGQTPPPKAFIGHVLALDGRVVPGATIRAFGRPHTPTSPRRLSKWLEGSEGAFVPGFRVRQLVRETAASLGGPQGLDCAAQAEANAILAQSFQGLEQGW